MGKKNKTKKAKKTARMKKSVYVPVKPIFGDGADYYVYELNAREKVLGCVLGLAAGAFVGLVFFRNIFISAVLGIITVTPVVRLYRNYLKEKRLRSLQIQFRDMLESLSASYSAGRNTEDAFYGACADLQNIYGNKADIVLEAKIIVDGCCNGLSIYELLRNFAERSHLDDINSFATIFEVSSRYGGNLRHVIGETREIINDKIETEMEIQTLLTANKNELNIMMAMPFIIMLMLNGMGDMSIVSNTPLNVAVKCGALILFAIAYLIGKKIVDIRL